MFKISTLDHLVLNVADPDKSLAFYEGGLGLETEHVREYREGRFPFPSVRVNAGTIIDLFPPQMHGAKSGGGRNVNHFCFVVEAPTAAIREHLTQLGIAITNAAHNNYGAQGIGDSLYVSDPDGNSVELKSYEEQSA